MGGIGGVILIFTETIFCKKETRVGAAWQFFSIPSNISKVIKFAGIGRFTSSGMGGTNGIFHVSGSTTACRFCSSFVSRLSSRRQLKTLEIVVAWKRQVMVGCSCQLLARNIDPEKGKMFG